MASLTIFLIILTHQKTKAYSLKIIQNFVRLAIFLEKSTINVIFAPSNSVSGLYYIAKKPTYLHSATFVDYLFELLRHKARQSTFR